MFWLLLSRVVSSRYRYKVVLARLQTRQQVVSRRRPRRFARGGTRALVQDRIADLLRGDLRHELRRPVLDQVVLERVPAASHAHHHVTSSQHLPEQKRATRRVRINFQN